MQSLALRELWLRPLRCTCLGGESLRLRERLGDLEPPEVDSLSLPFTGLSPWVLLMFLAEGGEDLFPLLTLGDSAGLAAGEKPATPSSRGVALGGWAWASSMARRRLSTSPSSCVRSAFLRV